MTTNEQNLMLFLTQINRRMKNNGNKTTIKWVKECKEAGITNTHKVVAIKRALLMMHLLKENDDGTFSWNKEKTEPNTLLPKGIESIIQTHHLMRPKTNRKKSVNRVNNITLSKERNTSLQQKKENDTTPRFISTISIDITFEYHISK